jgi:ATP-dependent DNA helicase RecG
MANILDREIQYLPGIGPKRAELLKKELDIHSFRDLLYTFPFRYLDRTRIYAISELEPSMAWVQIRGTIVAINHAGENRGKRLIATLADRTGRVDLIFFQGIKWMEEKVRLGKEFIVFGRPSTFNGSLNFVHPELEDPESALAQGSTMTGVYSSTEKLRNSGIGIKVFSKLIQKLLNQWLDHIPESLPESIRQQAGLIPLRQALRNIHFPENLQLLEQARARLKFEELFYLQLSLLKQRNVRMRHGAAPVFSRIGEYFNHCYCRIPFELTGAQKRVIKQIRSDARSGLQMNRLLQGDVGSGKTMVAFLCAAMAADNGYQTCLMAPTEVLAQQHYQGALAFAGDSGLKVALLTGSTKAKERRAILEGLEDGSIHLLVGTHAVIEDPVQFQRLGFAIIDEQHRFGVAQRARLRYKAELAPHILVMTATPIPRTLAMTLYGDLDVSVLDELPPGRKPITTKHIAESQRYAMYKFLKSEIKKGRQVFIVYPMIKESEKMDYQNLQSGYEEIVQEFPAPEYVTAVVHGQQKNEDKAHDMQLFAEGKAHILVATSVIEVGVNVPNASVMVIESAERFGLSQLHQLRGRVGRGAEQSFCLLMTGYKLSQESRQRIELMCSTNDGFELAEADLRMRGPGDIEGTQQSGLAIDLRLSNLAKDGSLLNYAREMANTILQNDPLLERPEHRLLAQQLTNLRHQGEEPVDYSRIS